MSTSDFCHRSALFSYALNSTATDTSQWVADFNHFVIFDAQSLVACHDFEYIDLMPVRDLRDNTRHGHEWKICKEVASIVARRETAR